MAQIILNQSTPTKQRAQLTGEHSEKGERYLTKIADHYMVIGAKYKAIVDLYQCDFQQGYQELKQAWIYKKRPKSKKANEHSQAH